MKLNKNSFSARLYRWVYATEQMPKNLCPYFWKLVIMWIVIVPYAILSLPYIALNKRNDIGSSFFEKPGSGLILYVGVGLVLSMLWSISIFFVGFFPKHSFAQSIQILGMLLWIIGIAIGGWNLAKWGIEKYKDSKIKYRYDGHGNVVGRKFEEPKPNIIVEYAKAAYNKYCPQINWEK
jgi:hypothetical protein